MPESPLNRTCEIFQNCLTKKKKKEKKKKVLHSSTNPSRRNGRQSANEGGRGKGKTKEFQIWTKLVEYDGVLCKKQTVKTNQVSKAETKQAEK